MGNFEDFDCKYTAKSYIKTIKNVILFSNIVNLIYVFNKNKIYSVKYV